MSVKVIRVRDVGNDQIEVTGRLEDGSEIAAMGWKSAMEQHYPPSAYAPMVQTIAGTEGEDDFEVRWKRVAADHPGAELHLKLDAEPRAMTEKEQHAYWQQLLDEKVAVEHGGDHNVLFDAEAS